MRSRAAGAAPGSLIAAAGTAVSLLAILVVMPAFSDGESDFYRRYAEVGGSPGGIAETVLTDPLHVVSRSRSTAAVSATCLRLLLPFGLVLLAPLTLVVALPELAINLLSSTPTQTSIHFHYTAAIIPALAAGSVFGAARIVRRRPGLATPLAGLSVVLALLSGWWLGPLPYPGGEDLAADAWRIEPHDRIATRALELIPPDATVSASNALGAHLSERKRILSFPYRQDADWVGGRRAAAELRRPGGGSRRGCRRGRLAAA